MRKILDSVVPTERKRSGSTPFATFKEKSRKISGAASTATTVSAAIMTTAVVITTLVDSSSSSSANVENSGTSVAESTPPRSSSYTMFGLSLALMYASLRAVPPITPASTLSLSKPVTRERAVPAATVRLLLSRLTQAAPLGPPVANLPALRRDPRRRVHTRRYRRLPR
jgi:hypothetical protein